MQRNIMKLIVIAVVMALGSHAMAKTCKVTQSKDSPKMAASPFSLRSVINAFNSPLSMQACNESISIETDIILEKPIILSQQTSSKGLVIEGKFDPKHRITINTSSIKYDDKDAALTGGKKCAIIVNTSNVTIKNLIINGQNATVGNGICILKPTTRLEGVMVFQMPEAGAILSSTNNVIGSSHSFEITGKATEQFTSAFVQNKGNGLVVESFNGNVANNVLSLRTIFFDNDSKGSRQQVLVKDDASSYSMTYQASETEYQLTSGVILTKPQAMSANGGALVFQRSVLANSTENVDPQTINPENYLIGAVNAPADSGIAKLENGFDPLLGFESNLFFIKIPKTNNTQPVTGVTMLVFPSVNTIQSSVLIESLDAAVTSPGVLTGSVIEGVFKVVDCNKIENANKPACDASSSGYSSNGGSDGQSTGSKNNKVYSFEKLDPTGTMPVDLAKMLNQCKSGVNIAVGVGVKDTDGDGISDKMELQGGSCVNATQSANSPRTNMFESDSDGDGIMDGAEDRNSNGFVDCYNEDANCTNGDTCKTLNGKNYRLAEPTYTAEAIKGVKVPDFTSLGNSYKLNPNVPGIPNSFKNTGSNFCVETDPRITDTDGDGRWDGFELYHRPENEVQSGVLYRLTNNSTGFVGSKQLDVNGNEVSCKLGVKSINAVSVGIEYHMVVRLPIKDTEKIKAAEQIFSYVFCKSINTDLARELNIAPSSFDSEFGMTNPLDHDTDGDGIADQIDNCPNKKGLTASGCPAGIARQCYSGWRSAEISRIAADLGISFDSAKQEVINLMNKGNYESRKKLDALKLKDSDADGIPDMVEGYNANSGSSSTSMLSENYWVAANSDTCGAGSYGTHPFKYLTDASNYTSDAAKAALDKGLTAGNDRTDPCPDQVDKFNVNGTPKACVFNPYTKGAAITACYIDRDNDGLVDCLEDLNLNGVYDRNNIMQDGKIVHSFTGRDGVVRNVGETDPLAWDSDNDNLSDFAELVNMSETMWGFTNPQAPDTDGDGINDFDEVKRDIQLNKDSTNTYTYISPSTQTGGCDIVKAKGSTTTQPMAQVDTDPTMPDTDLDGITDGIEEKIGTNPLNPDSDLDGLCDGDSDVMRNDGTGELLCRKGEVLKGATQYPYLPLQANVTDAEIIAALSIGSGTQLEDGTGPSNPCSNDTDGDGQLDSTDSLKTNTSSATAACTNKLGYDSDCDGIPDKFELMIGTDPTKADTDGDGLVDGCINMGTPSEQGELCAHVHNGTGFNDLGKGPGLAYKAGLNETDPLNPDTDSDGMLDGDELRYPDGQYKGALYEIDASGVKKYIGLYKAGVNLNPNNPDTDYDGIIDGIEAGARFISDTCDGGFCCHLNGVQAVQAGKLNPAFKANPFQQKGSQTDALNADTDNDGLIDGNNLTSLGRFSKGEDLNCNGIVDQDTNGNATETNPRMPDSNGDGVNDQEAICRNGVCDPGQNVGFAYSRLAGQGCTNTMMPGMSVPATPADLMTLAMLLAPIGMALRMRTRRKR